jgi:hypothetical protein
MEYEFIVYGAQNGHKGHFTGEEGLVPEKKRIGIVSWLTENAQRTRA